jgi:hypothetical protein
MSEQENRNTLERFFQAFSRHDLDAIDDLAHGDYVEEHPQSDAVFEGPGRLPPTTRPGSSAPRCAERPRGSPPRASPSCRGSRW